MRIQASRAANGLLSYLATILSYHKVILFVGNSLSEINPSFKALLANAYAETFSLPQSELFKIFYAALTEAAGLSANTPENSVHELSQMVSDTKTESQLQFLEFIDATVKTPISSTIQNKIKGYYISKQINDLLQQGEESRC